MRQSSESIFTVINRSPIKMNHPLTILLSDIESLQVSFMVSRGGS